MWANTEGSYTLTKRQVCIRELGNMMNHLTRTSSSLEPEESRLVHSHLRLAVALAYSWRLAHRHRVYLIIIIIILLLLGTLLRVMYRRRRRRRYRLIAQRET